MKIQRIIANVLTASARIALTAAAIAGVAPVGTASALDLQVAPGTGVDVEFPRTPITQAHLPLTITAGGSYYLAQNLRGAGWGTSVITVNVPNVTIDLNGFTIDGTTELGYSNDCISIGAVENVSISNGTIRECKSEGIYAQSATFVQLDQVKILHNLGVGAKLGDASLVTRSIFAHNGSQGLQVGNGSVVDSTLAHQNEGTGIIGYDGLVATGVAARANGQTGIYGFSGSTITAASATENHTGIKVAFGGVIHAASAYANEWEGMYGMYHAVMDSVAAVSNGYLGIYNHYGVNDSAVAIANGGVGFSGAHNTTGTVKSDD